MRNRCFFFYAKKINVSVRDIADFSLNQGILKPRRIQLQRNPLLMALRIIYVPERNL